MRQLIIKNAIQTLVNYSQINPVKNYKVLDRAKVLSSLAILEHLLTQYNVYEYNRILVSRECYIESIRFILDDLPKPENGSLRFIEAIN